MYIGQIFFISKNKVSVCLELYQNRLKIFSPLDELYDSKEFSTFQSFITIENNKSFVFLVSK